MTQIDYTKLNDRIVKQAVDIANLALSEEMKIQLFQNKIDRAAAMLKARETNSIVYPQIED
jgi:hypothetical protein